MFSAKFESSMKEIGYHVTGGTYQSYKGMVVHFENEVNQNTYEYLIPSGEEAVSHEVRMLKQLALNEEKCAH